MTRRAGLKCTLSVIGIWYLLITWNGLKKKRTFLISFFFFTLHPNHIYFFTLRTQYECDTRFDPRIYSDAHSRRISTCPQKLASAFNRNKYNITTRYWISYGIYSPIRASRRAPWLSSTWAEDRTDRKRDVQEIVRNTCGLEYIPAVSHTIPSHNAVRFIVSRRSFRPRWKRFKFLSPIWLLVFFFFSSHALRSHTVVSSHPLPK